MDAEGQRVEVEAAWARDHDFAVENALLGKLVEQGFAEIGEIAVEGLAVSALDEEVVAVAKDDGAETVPLGLEAPGVGVRGEFVDALGEHGEDRRGEWLGHGELDAGFGRGVPRISVIREPDGR